MRTRLHLAATAVAVAALQWAAPAQALDFPEDPTQLFLKNHLDLPLTWTGDTAVLAAGGQTVWRLVDTEENRVSHLPDEGTVTLLDEATGLCLSAEPMALLEDHAGVHETDCAEATVWTLTVDNTPRHRDVRFVTEEGYLLGTRTNNVDSGDTVYVWDTEVSLHSQEWKFGVPEQSIQPAAAPAPELPQTGASVAVTSAAAVAAIGLGAALLLWWRRRTLRSHW